MAPLGEYQVRVGILPVRAAPVDRQRIGQPLRAGQLPGEARGRLPPPGRAQLLGQGELHLAVQPPVGPLVLVCHLPVFPGVVLGPLRHVSVLFVLQFLSVLLVAALALDVIALGARRLPPGAGTEASFQMIDCHATTPLAYLLAHRFI